MRTTLSAAHLLSLAHVPATSVANTEEGYHDPQLHHRHFPVFVDHPDLGCSSNPGTPYRLTVTPGGIDRVGPRVGQHTREVLERWAGADQHRRRRVRGRGRGLRPRRALRRANVGKVDSNASLWNAEPHAVWLDTTVGHVLARQAAATPDTPALHWTEADTVVTWTYGELWSASARVATALRTSVEYQHMRGGVATQNSLEWVAAFYGAAQVGATFVPINPAMGAHEMEQILTLAAPSLVLDA